MCLSCSDLSHNNIMSLSRSSLLAAASLTSLDLSHNLLSSSPEPPPLLPSLQTLILSFNPLFSLSLCSISGMPKLLELQVRPALAMNDENAISDVLSPSGCWSGVDISELG